MMERKQKKKLKLPRRIDRDGEIRRPRSKTWGGEERKSNRQQQKRRLRDGDYDI